MNYPNPMLHEWTSLFTILLFMVFCIQTGRWLERDDARIKNEEAFKKNTKIDTRA